MIKNSEEYFGAEFIRKFNNILEESLKEYNFLFLHGTYTKEDAEDICKYGLKCDYPELMYTSELIDKVDKLLYDKLKSWPHWDLKYLVMILVNKGTGKSGIPIWTQNQDLSFTLNPEFLKGYIDVNNKQILLNPRYKLEHNYSSLIEDTSYQTRTGKKLQISIPLEEEIFYQSSFRDEK